MGAFAARKYRISEAVYSQWGLYTSGTEAIVLSTHVGLFPMHDNIIDAIGMLGTLMVIVAYYLLQLERIDPKSLRYNLMNLVGAVFLFFSLCFNFNLASLVIEVFWIGASIIGLWKYWRRHAVSEI